MKTIILLESYYLVLFTYLLYYSFINMLFCIYIVIILKKIEELQFKSGKLNTDFLSDLLKVYLFQ